MISAWTPALDFGVTRAKRRCAPDAFADRVSLAATAASLLSAWKENRKARAAGPTRWPPE